LASSFCKLRAQQLQAVIGVNAEFGSNYRRIGLKLGAWYTYHQIQINMLSHFFYNAKSIGAQGKCWEMQCSGSAILAFGAKNNLQFNPSFFNEQFSAIQQDWKISYAYKMYFDTRGTTQQLGNIHLQYKQFSINSLNDGYAFTPFDEYRTGSFQIHYMDSFVHLGANIVLWTGATKNGIVVKDSISNFGSIDISKNKHGKYSAGLGYFSAAFALQYQQNIFAQIGVDDERIRNGVQNKMIHNSRLVHKVLPSINDKQLPMLDKNGNAFINKNVQQIKKRKVVYQIGINELLGY
jgi:Bacterial toxin 23